MERKCKKVLQVLCYMCGLHTPKGHERKFTDKLQQLYEAKYLILPIESSYTPRILCKPCATVLTEKRTEKINLLTPMEWVAPDENHQRCYGCLMPSLSGSNWRNRHIVKYPQPGTTTSRHPT